MDKKLSIYPSIVGIVIGLKHSRMWCYKKNNQLLWSRQEAGCKCKEKKQLKSQTKKFKCEANPGQAEGCSTNSKQVQHGTVLVKGQSADIIQKQVNKDNKWLGKKRLGTKTQSQGTQITNELKQVKENKKQTQTKCKKILTRRMGSWECQGVLGTGVLFRLQRMMGIGVWCWCRCDSNSNFTSC